MPYKIYKRGGYFYIVDTATNREREGLSKDVKVSRGTTVQTDFYFQHINNWSESQAINISEIQDQEGVSYTLAKFIEFYESSTSVDINIQDLSSDVIGLYLSQTLDTASLIANEAVDDESIGIETTGTTPVVGNFILFQEGEHTTQNEILTVTPIAGNQYTIEIDIPLDFAYTTAAELLLQNVDMDADGTTTPIDFVIGPMTGVKWDITRILIGMVLSSAGDDGLFGNITALTKGTCMRNDHGAHTHNLFNIKDNSDFAMEGFDLNYTTRSGGGGSYGMRSRITFAGPSKRGAVIRLEGDTDEFISSTVRDNLTGLNKFRIKVQGHVTED